MNRSGFISLSIFILLLPLNLFGETDSIKGKAVFCSFNEGYLNIYKRTKECNAEGFYFETEDTVKVMSIKNETENFNSPPPDENGYNRCATSSKEYGYQFTDIYKYEVFDYEIKIYSVSEKVDSDKPLINLLIMFGLKPKEIEEKTLAVLNRETLRLDKYAKGYGRPALYYQNCEAYNSKEELIKAGEDFFENFLDPREIRIQKYYKKLKEEREKEEEERKKKRKI